MQYIDTFLKQLGLKEPERRVYTYLFSHGESIVSIIAKRLSMKRPTVYQILDTLERIGIVSIYSKNGVSHFDVSGPDAIVELCEQKKQRSETILDRAKVLQNEYDDMRKKGVASTLQIRGKMHYYEGLDAVTQLIDETLHEDAGEQLCFGLNTYHSELSGKDWELYTQKRVKKGMRVRSIQPDTNAAALYKKRDVAELRTTRLVPVEIFPGSCEVNIIGDMIAMFTIRDTFASGMKMYNKEMAETLRSLYELAWERAEEYDKKH